MFVFPLAGYPSKKFSKILKTHEGVFDGIWASNKGGIRVWSQIYPYKRYVRRIPFRPCRFQTKHFQTFSFARAATDEMDADSDTDLPEVTVRQVGAKWRLRTSIAGKANGAKLRRFESCPANGFGPYVDELSARENALAFAKFVVLKSRTSAASNRNPARPTPRQKSALPSGYIACVV